jgi:hypothetical protein
MTTTKPARTPLPILVLAVILPGPSLGQGLERVRVSEDGRGFVLEPSGEAFRAHGFNYDHDEEGRLLEDYWLDEWPKVEEDFQEMKDLGARVVRIHLQFGRFFPEPGAPDREQLDRLGDLLDLADRVGLYLNLTGLGCYHKQDVPDWYDDLSEADRWEAQAEFWRAIAGRCVGRPAVFCYDLMNEPVVAGARREPGDWLGPGFGDKHFVQFIALDPDGRDRPEVAREWIRALASAIREVDPEALITVGLVPWSLDRPGLTSGFVPDRIADELDFIAMHLYPEAGKLDEALETLEGFRVGKPLVIEETFPLKCGPDEFAEFIREVEPGVAGIIGFYWGKTVEEMTPPATFGEAFMVRWLEFFREDLADRDDPEP